MVSKGKWSQPGVPHKDWSCDDIEDLEDERAICEMCEAQEIRFVHYMSHPDFSGTLACGCDCAGHMEGNSGRAEKRDRAMRNAVVRRKNFPNLKSWKISYKGNPILRKDGSQVTIFPQANGYKFVANHRLLQNGKFGRKVFSSIREAKLAAFDALIWLDDHWQEIK